MAEFTFSKGTAAGQHAFLEVGDVPTVTQVTREGTLVRAVNFNNDRVNELIDKLRVPARNLVPRVVTQSVPAGTLVQRGTVIDLVLVRPVDIRFDLFGKVHPALMSRTVADILGAMTSTVTTIVAAKDDPATLTTAERDAVNGFLLNQHIATAGGVNENSFESVYGLLVDIQVFK